MIHTVLKYSTLDKGQHEPENPRTGHGTQGYGFQTWIAREGFYGAGLGGQFSIAIPKYNACIAFSAYDHPKSDFIFETIWDIIVPALM